MKKENLMLTFFFKISYMYNYQWVWGLFLPFKWDYFSIQRYEIRIAKTYSWLFLIDILPHEHRGKQIRQDYLPSSAPSQYQTNESFNRSRVWSIEATNTLWCRYWSFTHHSIIRLHTSKAFCIFWSEFYWIFICKGPVFNKLSLVGVVTPSAPIRSQDTTWKSPGLVRCPLRYMCATMIAMI